MISSVTGSVVSKPSSSMLRESPTSTMSAPDWSTSRAVGKSYAVSATSFSPRRFFGNSPGTVTGFSPAMSLSVDFKMAK